MTNEKSASHTLNDLQCLPVWIQGYQWRQLVKYLALYQWKWKDVWGWHTWMEGNYSISQCTECWKPWMTTVHTYHVHCTHIYEHTVICCFFVKSAAPTAVWLRKPRRACIRNRNIFNTWCLKHLHFNRKWLILQWLIIFGASSDLWMSPRFYISIHSNTQRIHCWNTNSNNTTYCHEY